MNQDIVNFIILSFWSLFVIVDPVGLVPAFLVMTEHNNIGEKVHVAKIASIVTFLLLVSFALGGRWILSIFGISFSAFEIAGGIILLKIALDMLQAKRTALKETPEEQAEGSAKEDIAITPLAVPMLAGPGALTAVVLLCKQAPNFIYGGIVIGNIFFVSLITFLILRLASYRSTVFSTISLKIMTRLMGLLLAAIAIQFILNGIQKTNVLF